MNGVIVIDKPKNYTSRDVVNIISKVYKTKKVGHTGTLDPLATGVLIVCINKATKLVELLTSENKEYIATFELGTLTDTLDSTGKVLKDDKAIIKREEIEELLKTLVGDMIQTVPIYSAIKVNGRKLYDYARNNEEVVLPKHNIKIYEIELLDLYYTSNKTIIKIKTLVSKGTYIRSLGNDIGVLLGTNAIMTDLRRTKQGQFNIENAVKLDEINFNTKLISITECLNDYYKVVANSLLLEDLKHGRFIKNIYNNKNVLFVNSDNNALALYTDEDGILKPNKMF